MKRIVFIGAGNLATRLSIKLYDLKYTILQIYSRTEISASLLAKEVNASFTSNIEEIDPHADIYIFSVKDSVLEELIAQMPLNSGLWLHTAGSMPLNVFENKTKTYGVLYPFQTFSKERKVVWDNIPLFIEGYNETTLDEISKLANKISQKVYPISSEQRQYVHTSGVFACNFVNHMYSLANDIVGKVNLPLEILLPLIDETARKIHILSPDDAQTGPAIRYDRNVMEKHLSLLGNERIEEIYKLISKSIYDKNKRNNID